MSGSGQYLPDPTEGITRPADPPKAKIVRRSRNFRHWPCPHYGKSCFRQTVATRIWDFLKTAKNGVNGPDNWEQLDYPSRDRKGALGQHLRPLPYGRGSEELSPRFSSVEKVPNSPGEAR